MRRAVIAAVLVAAGLAAAPAEGTPRTPIRHFVVLMQENHSFDNYFGTYPGADGIPKGTCMPAGTARGCIRPFHIGGRAAPELGHDPRIHRIEFAGGRMDGFVRAASIDRQKVEPGVMGYYDARDIPFYWRVAGHYVLFDRFFASTDDGSVASHMAWVTGRRDAADGPFRDLPTIFDRLDERGISWKFYVENYDPRLAFGAGRRSDGGAQSVRVPLLRYPRYVRDRRLFRHIVDLEQYYEDLENDRLPAVAYIAPAGASEHPPGRLKTGQALVRSLIIALSRSRAWNSSAFMWTYDNWGGWFDHVPPPTVDGRRYGFRVPALLVSPYARRGHVDGTRLDTTSIARFIEHNWGLGARTDPFAGAFDFSRPPRRPVIMSAEPARARQREPRRWVIYLAYGAAVLLAAVLAGWSALRPHVRAGAPFVLAALLVVGPPPSPARAGPPEREVQPLIRTVPPVPGMRFAANGVEFAAGRGGIAHPPPGLAGRRSRLAALNTDVAPGVRARFDRWYRGGRIAAIDLYYRVGPTFADLNGEAVDPAAVSSVTLMSSNGRRQTFTGNRPRWLQGNRVIPESRGTRSTALSYAVEDAVVDGSSVVHRAQQRFIPSVSRRLEVRLLLFSIRFQVRDALFGFPIGSEVRLESPNGRERRASLGRGGEVTLRSLPRGDYRVGARALGISTTRPVALSGDQEVALQVVSWLDVAVVVLGLASLALALLFVRRPGRRLRVRGSARVAASLVLLAGAALAASPGTARAASRPDPLYAYYYIWFNPTSWSRAKIDYPLLGRYSSDERAVMLKHVQWAKRAGIDGFIVSWKSTPVLNRRLERLTEVADAEHFKLLVIYQGLDFFRRPLPAARVARDLDHFEARFAPDEAFRVFEKPTVIWSGTPSFTAGEIARVTGPRRKRLLILASERNMDGYRRVARSVDGNAYYWASVNPSTFPGYPERLARMGEAVHRRGGLWIAPAAPGFDARKVGGTSVVERRDGDTLRTELDAAARSSPDAIGLISWNEFSENTHIEPSVRNGTRYLDVVADVRHARLPGLRDFDSSEPAATSVGYGMPLIGGIGLFFAASACLLARRAYRRRLPLRG
jgi:phospholipase C